VARIGRFKLRNEIIRLIARAWGKKYGCVVIPGDAVFHREHSQLKFRRFSELIIGYNGDGKAIFIYPQPTRGLLNVKLAKFLKAAYDKGCHVGLAGDVYDAYDIIANDPVNYKRKPRTLYFIQRALEKDDETEEHGAEIRNFNPGSASDADWQRPETEAPGEASTTKPGEDISEDE
jgi:hypothetical protein